MRFAFGTKEEFFILVQKIQFSMSMERSDHKLVLFLELKTKLFHDIEARRWFDIPVVYTEQNQIDFAPDIPIQMQVEFKAWDMLLQRYPFPEGDDQEILLYIFDRLQTDMTAYSPLNYHVVYAEQKQPEQTLFFSWEQIQAWENRYRSS